jgi:hypothetical protein
MSERSERINVTVIRASGASWIMESPEVTE